MDHCPQLTIFLDLDEVLADFVGGALKLWDLPREQFLQRQELGTWDMTIGLGVTHEEFWREITVVGELFWSRLDQTPWFDKLMRLVEPHEWYVVSSPSRCPSSHYGKSHWLKRQFGQQFDRFFLSPHKHLLAGPGRLLIDDNEQNCKRWYDAGGTAILFPMWGNRLWVHQEEPMIYVREKFYAFTVRQCERRVS